MHSTKVLLSVMSCPVDGLTQVTWQIQVQVHGFYVFPQVSPLAGLLATAATLPLCWSSPHRKILNLLVYLLVWGMIWFQHQTSLLKINPILA